jgi:hypothetical protein
MAVLPLLVLIVIWARDRYVVSEAWWLAAAFLVSWLADWPAHFGVDPWLVSTAYPLLQAGIVVSLLATRREASLVLVALTVVGLWSVARTDGTGPDVALRMVGWGAIVVLAFRQHGFPLRWPLLLYFGGSLLGWLGYVSAPSWSTWGAYQLARAVGIGMFCWAVWPRKATVAA